MTDVRDELWAELLDAGKVRWMPGMLASGYGIVCPDCDAMGLGLLSKDRHAPDWENPATLGCLTAMAREAWGNPAMHVRCYEDVVSERLVYQLFDGFSAAVRGGAYPTEAEAILRAIKAAP